MRSKVVVLFLVWLFLPLVLAAQAPVAELNGSYEYTRVNASVGDLSGRPKANAFNANGGGGQLAFNVTRHFGVVADFAGTAFSEGAGAFVPVDVKVATYAVGLRAGVYPGGWHLYAQALGGGASAFANFSVSNIGGARASSSSSALLLGGGLEKNLAPWVAFRVFEVDYLRTAVFNRTQNNARIGAGFTFRFGKR